MARNQPFDFSDDDDIGITPRSSSSDLLGASAERRQAGRSDMSDADLLGDAAAQQAGRRVARGPRGAEVRPADTDRQP